MLETVLNGVPPQFVIAESLNIVGSPITRASLTVALSNFVSTLASEISFI
jgi:hypothetical protein